MASWSGAATAAAPVTIRASRGEMPARPISRMTATWAAASAWRPVRTADSTRSKATRSACGTWEAKEPSRADRSGLLVSALEVALPHRGQRPGVAPAGLHGPAAARPGPASYLVGELLGGVVVAAGGGQQRLTVLQQPGKQPVPAGPAETEALLGQPSGLVPLAGPEGVEAELHHRVDGGRDGAALPAVADHSP